MTEIVKTTHRPTWAEIDLAAVRHNLACVRVFLRTDVGVMGIVKADAYGHGIRRVSRVLSEEGVQYLGVATVDEALEVRDEGLDVPVLVMGSVLPEEVEPAVINDVTLTLCDKALLDKLIEVAQSTQKRPRVHVMVDTGMGRIGVWREDALAFIDAVHREEWVELEGVYTHFSSAGRDKEYTTSQIASFERILGRLEEMGIDVKYRHAANSIALIDWERTHLNLVRPGILLYGIYPKRSFRDKFRLEPAMSLKTRISFLKDVPPGRSLSYGRTYITESPTKIATIPIGYADGYGRILSNKAQAIVRGVPVRVAGVVTMDQTLLNVGGIEGVAKGDEVVLIGRQGDALIPVEKLAKLAGTIPYEIVTGITKRVPRVYKN